MNASSTLTSLRAATKPAHEALEVEANVEARLRDEAARPAMVAAFLALHRSIEAAIAPWTSQMTAMGWVPHARTPGLEQSVVALGGRVETTADAPPADSLGRAFGLAYVAEGSMLGGRVMLKGMRRDGVSLEGLDFLDPHGEGTGARWTGFLAAMDAAVQTGRATEDDIVAGGVAGFTTAWAHLAPDAKAEQAA